MSDNWHLSLLCSADSVTQRAVEDLVGRLAELLGYGAADEPIWCMSGDGLTSFRFGSPAAAASWLGSGEGGLPLERDDVQLFVSIQRRDGAIATAMTGRSDQPHFDELTLSTPSSRVTPSTWPRILRAWRIAIESTPIVFAHAMTEDMYDLVWSELVVHRRVMAGRLPTFLPWLCAIPVGSPLIEEMNTAAGIIGRPIDERAGILTMTLADDPWNAPVTVFARASSRWSAMTGEAG